MLTLSTLRHQRGSTARRIARRGCHAPFPSWGCPCRFTASIRPVDRVLRATIAEGRDQFQPFAGNAPAAARRPVTAPHGAVPVAAVAIHGQARRAPRAPDAQCPRHGWAQRPGRRAAAGHRAARRGARGSRANPWAGPARAESAGRPAPRPRLGATPRPPHGGRAPRRTARCPWQPWQSMGRPGARRERRTPSAPAHGCAQRPGRRAAAGHRAARRGASPVTPRSVPGPRR
jgi:hypothetical protein